MRSGCGNLNSRDKWIYLSKTGAITTDYIILTGAIMGVSLSATVAVRSAVSGLGVEIESSLANASVTNPLVPPAAAPVRWSETVTSETAGTRCPPAPATCNFTPPTRWETAYLEMDDGTRLERLTTTEYPDSKSASASTIWRNEEGEEVEAPKNVPDLDYALMTCDEWGNCRS
jgi:hypothetical protein